MTYICRNCGKSAESPRFQHRPGCMGLNLNGQSAVREAIGTGIGAGTCPSGHALHWNSNQTLRFCFLCDAKYPAEVRHAN